MELYPAGLCYARPKHVYRCTRLGLMPDSVVHPYPTAVNQTTRQPALIWRFISTTGTMVKVYVSAYVVDLIVGLPEQGESCECPGNHVSARGAVLDRVGGVLLSMVELLFVSL